MEGYHFTRWKCFGPGTRVCKDRKFRRRLASVSRGKSWHRPCAKSFRHLGTVRRLKNQGPGSVHIRSFVDMRNTEGQLLAHRHPFMIATLPLILAAAGYSFLYLLLGGGIGGAIIIFIVAKMLGK